MLTLKFSSCFRSSLNDIPPILLHKIKKKIVRIMTFSNYPEETIPLFESLEILNIFELNTYLTVVFMYLYYHDKLPAFFNNVFITNDNLHSYNTR